MIAADITVLRPLLPPGVLASVTNTYDILPPPSGTNYDQSYFGIRQRNARHPNGRQDAGRALQQILRNGIPGANDSPEARAAFEAQLERAAAEFGIPGGLPGADDRLPDDEWSDTSDEAHENAAQEDGNAGPLMRLLRGLFGRPAEPTDPPPGVNNAER